MHTSTSAPPPPRRRRRRTLRLAVAAALVAGAVASCSESDDHTRVDAAGLPDLEQSLRAHEWRLDPDDSTVADAGGEPVTLVFEDDERASGTAGCNTYRAQVELDDDGDEVRLSDISATFKDCGTEVMAAEQAYLDALARVRTADVTDRDRLVLSADGVELAFSAAD